jgi:hypothetical protein
MLLRWKHRAAGPLREAQAREIAPLRCDERCYIQRVRNSRVQELSSLLRNNAGKYFMSAIGRPKLKLNTRNCSSSSQQPTSQLRKPPSVEIRSVIKNSASDPKLYITKDSTVTMPTATILIADGSEEIEFVTPYDGAFSHKAPTLPKR